MGDGPVGKWMGIPLNCHFPKNRTFMKCYSHHSFKQTENRIKSYYDMNCMKIFKLSQTSSKFVISAKKIRMDVILY